MISRIANYQLKSSILDVPDLVEFSLSEYKLLQTMFPDEKIFGAPSVKFLGFEWEVVIGSIKDRIYKIQLQTPLESAGDADHILSKVVTYCLEEMGQPAERKRIEGMEGIVWHSNEGNVIVGHCVEGTPYRVVNLSLTSSEVIKPSG